MNKSRSISMFFTSMRLLCLLLLVGFSNAFAASATYEAERATVVGARVIGGYVDYVNPSGDYIEWNVNAASAGVYDLDFKYALLKGGRYLEIRIDGNVVNSKLGFPSTLSWSVYKTVRVSKALKAGLNKVRATAIGDSGPNMDSLIVTPAAGTPDPNPNPGPVDPPVTGRPLVVAYAPNWRSFASMSQQLQYSKLTHINIAFENPNSNGDLSYNSTFNNAIISAAHARNVKVLVSLGGASTGTNATLKANYTRQLVSAATRAVFINKISNYLTQHNLDGVDIDIEGPGIKGVGHYGEFIIELSNKLKPQKKLVTSALSVGYGGADVPTSCLAYFDFINIMAYDAAGPWSGPGQHSPMSQATQNISFWKNRGVPGKRLVLGVPFYGYGWGAYAYGDEWSYSRIVGQFPGAENRDSVGSGSSVIYYNGIPTIQAKSRLVATHGLAGMMMWSLDSDATGAKSLLSAMHSVLNP